MLVGKAVLMSSCLEQTAWTAACNKVVLVKLSASFFLAQQGKKQLMHQTILSEKLDDLKVVTHLEVVTHRYEQKSHNRGYALQNRFASLCPIQQQTRLDN